MSLKELDDDGPFLDPPRSMLATIHHRANPAVDATIYVFEKSLQLFRFALLRVEFRHDFPDLAFLELLVRRVSKPGN